MGNWSDNVVPFHTNFTSFTEVPPDEPHGETGCCGFSDYSVVCVNKYMQI